MAGRFGRIGRAARPMKMGRFASRSFSLARIICRPGPVGIRYRLHPLLPFLRLSASQLSTILRALIFLPLPQFPSFLASPLNSISLYPRNPAFAGQEQSRATPQANLSIFKFSLPLESLSRLVIDLIPQPETFAFLVSGRVLTRSSQILLPST